MRSLHVLLVVGLLAGVIGCSLFEKRTDPPRPTTPVAKVTADQLVKYLNDRASRLQTISAEVRFTARDGLIASPSLHGNLAASQPRNFRMAGGGGMAAKVDLGSNSDQFWVYFEAPTVKPMFVFAAHSDFEAGRAKLPGGIPFEPDWVMQALGMHKFPENIPYGTPEMRQSERTYTLSWQSETPTKMVIKKEVVFDADDARDGRPQVKKHLIRDSKNKLLCSAEVKKVNTVPIGGTDPQVPQVAVQYPTHVVLRWEVQNFELDLILEKVQVNQNLDEQTRKLFKRPEYPDPKDLATVEFSVR